MRGQDYSGDPTFAEFFPANPAEDWVWRSYPGNHPPGLPGAIGYNLREWAKAVQRRRDGVEQPDCYTFPDIELGGHVMMILKAAFTSWMETGGEKFVDVEEID